MNFPVKLKFKIFAIAPQIYAYDSTGHLVHYIKQKLFKLKEEVTVFADEDQEKPQYKIAADRIIDFSAAYSFTDMQGRKLGSIKRKGMKSLWSAHYEIYDAEGEKLFTVEEENAWIKVIDALFGEIPVVNIFMGYFFNPKYSVSSGSGMDYRITKKRSFLESGFEVSKEKQGASNETLVLLGAMMFVLLERMRG
ncbi:MAG TPA: hypothetical protein PL048_15840 [Leptospiraceae bacterium]|nr:hypothetical protein [Leptospiraceae bacterium]HMZ60248.1 hypothetical protein [Leptospiraceae bacterium]HNF26114.1 hypothetical protein [Leptospiraceae bacterium]HNI96632.1 hypothetical protein [Leptospiraceae bacterium]